MNLARSLREQIGIDMVGAPRPSLKVVLKKGHFAVIYRERIFGCPMVAKVYRRQYNDLNDELASEMKNLQTMTHPNLVQFIGAIRIDREYIGQMAIIMEFAHGGNLETALEHGQIKKDDAYVENLVFQMASGLTYLHSKIIIHKNIKPSNILFRDFARTQVALGDFSTATDQQLMFYVGDPLFQPPECDYNFSTDVYSLGMVSCCVLMGFMPERRKYILDKFIPTLRENLKRYRPICKAILERDTMRPTALEFRNGFDPTIEPNDEGYAVEDVLTPEAERILRFSATPDDSELATWLSTFATGSFVVGGITAFSVYMIWSLVESHS